MRRRCPTGAEHEMNVESAAGGIVGAEAQAAIQNRILYEPEPPEDGVQALVSSGTACRQRANLGALVPARNNEPSGATAPCGANRGGRVPWAELLRRVFAADVLACPCSGQRRVVTVVVGSASHAACLPRHSRAKAASSPIRLAASTQIR
jgi:hypothetical protein